MPRRFSRYGLALVSVLIGLLLACGDSSSQSRAETARIQGRTMGTSYSVILPMDRDGSIQAATVRAAIDSLLTVINADVNTYDRASLISRLNRGDTLLLPQIDAVDELQFEPGAHIAANLQLCDSPFEITAGAFDPTVAPLVEYYGFGSTARDSTPIDETEVQRLLDRVGFEKVVRQKLAEGRLMVFVATTGVALDLSAIAKGYAVDQVGLLLRDRFGVSDCMVEIGGETRVWGNSPRGSAWNIAINTPEEAAAITDIEAVLAVQNLALATSGNYRNVRSRGGKRYVHTINPRDGSAAPSNLLSATVLAENCATADAYATASMASGEDAMEVLAKAGLDACLIFAGEGDSYDVRYVGDFAKYILTRD